MFKIFKAAIILSVPGVTNIVSGIIRTKLTSLILQPSGVGILAQSLNFQQFIITISSLNIGAGLVKYISKSNTSKQRPEVLSVICYAIQLQAVVTLAIIVLVTLFSKNISYLLFSKIDYKFYLIVLMLTVPFSVLALNIENILTGLGHYTAFAKARSLSNIISLLPLFVFIYSLGVKGGFLYLATNSLLLFIIAWFFLYNKELGYVARGIFDVRKVISAKNNLIGMDKKLIAYVKISLLNASLSLLTVVILRTFIIRYLGSEANGYYQVVFSISAIYLSFFTNTFGFYLYPKISAIENKRHYSIEINQAVRFCIFLMVPVMASLFLFREQIIKLIYTFKFIYAKELFALQLFGDLFFLLYYIMGTSLLASIRLKWLLIFNLLNSLIFVGSFFLTYRFLGLKATTSAYAISSFILFLSTLYYHIKVMDFNFYKRNSRLFLSAIVLTAIIFFLVNTNNFTSILLKISLIAGWLRFFSTKSERRNIFNIISSRLRGE